MYTKGIEKPPTNDRTPDTQSASAKGVGEAHLAMAQNPRVGLQPMTRGNQNEALTITPIQTVTRASVLSDFQMAQGKVAFSNDAVSTRETKPPAGGSTGVPTDTAAKQDTDRKDQHFAALTKKNLAKEASAA
jgi:hypothetical protein